MITQKDLDEILNRLKETFVTKDDFTKYNGKLFDKLDEIVVNTSDTKTVVELLENRVSDIEETLQISH